MSMSTCPWLLDFLAKPTVIRSPLLSHRGRSGVDGGLWGSRSHLCNRFMVKCYTNAYKGFSLFLFPAPSSVSLSFSRLFLRASLSLLLPLPPFFSRPRLPRSFFLARASIAECIGTSEHPLVIVVANPLAAAGICRLPFRVLSLAQSPMNTFDTDDVPCEISENRR